MHIVVTGASSGIGREIAKAFDGGGNRISLVARRLKLLDAIEKRKARVIYPRFYTLGWWLPSVGRWVAENFVPEATGAVTPLLGGDLG